MVFRFVVVVVIVLVISLSNNNNSSSKHSFSAEAASVSDRCGRVPSFKVMDVMRRAGAIEEGLEAATAEQDEMDHDGHDDKKTNSNNQLPVLHCEVGQPETGAPGPVAAAALEALQRNMDRPGEAVMGYTDSFGLLDLRRKIARHYATNYGGKLTAARVPDVDNICVTTGSSGAFLLAFTACFDAGDAVAIASSGYPCYRNILAAVSCVSVSVPVNAQFKLTATELRQEMDRRAAANEAPLKGLILSSPSNPTGAMLSPAELEELCRLCDENNIQFLSDEIYHGISYGMPEATALQFSNKAVVINSFSKYYSMSGWRLGWMVLPPSNPALVDAVNRLQQNFYINAPTISQTAALRCWDDDTVQELEGHVEKYRTSRRIILEALGSIPELPQENVAPADGGFYVYVDLGESCIAPGVGSVAMCRAVLEEYHVAFTPGTDFEDAETNLGDRRFRISYAGGIDTARQAMDRFLKFWPTWMDRVRAAREAIRERAVAKRQQSTVTVLGDSD